MPQASQGDILFDILLLIRSKHIQFFMDNKTSILSDLVYFFKIYSICT